MAMELDGPEHALRLRADRARQCNVPTPSPLFRPQTGSLSPRAVRWGWRGPRLLGLDRGHELRRAVEGLMEQFN